MLFPALVCLLIELGALSAIQPLNEPQPEIRPDAVLIRFPDVSRDQIAFRYDGDIWTVPKTGGEARRVTSPAGNEGFPRFSPDGKRLAVMAGYEGGNDLYVLDLEGGLPVRVTWHPGDEMLCDWHPNGEELVFWSNRNSGQARAPKIFTIPAAGGEARELPVPYGTFASIDESGRLLAYTPITREFRTWKRYQGGMAQDIWLFDLETKESQEVTDHPGTDSLPMWHGRRIVFLSDRGEHNRLNLWQYDVDSEETTQLTTFAEWDCKFPSIGPEDVVFENGGKLWRYEFASGRSVEVPITIPGDRKALRSQTHSATDLVQSADIGPTGARVVVEARGDVFTVPVEEGFVRNLTRTDDSAERAPAWSPDGKWIAYFADRELEYDLFVRRSDGRTFTWDDEETAQRRVAALEPNWKYEIFWSPDSEHLVYSTNSGELNLVGLDSGEVELVHRDPTGGRLRANWSHDSSWLAFDASIEGTLTSGIYLYERATGAKHLVTSEFFSNSAPVFDPNGDWLYFKSDRTFQPIYSSFDDTWIYANATNLCAVPLRKDVEDPWAPENQEEFDEDAEDEDGENGDDEDSDDEDSDDENSDDEDEDEEDKDGDDKNGDDDEAKDDEDDDEPVVIELEGFESRARQLPVPPGNFGRIAAVEDKVVYVRRPRTGSEGDQSQLAFYELGEDEEASVLSEVGDFALTADGKKVLVVVKGSWGVIELKPDQKLEERLDLSGLVVTVDPRSEWRQIVRDAHRVVRDFFYVENMHGVDWDALRDRYLEALSDATSRDDVHYLIGEMIGELNVGHAYNRAPKEGLQKPDEGPVAGLLGCDWELVDGTWRIARIVGGAVYDYDARAPLAQQGIDVREGDWLLAVNGQPVDGSTEVYKAFLGTVDKPTELLVNDEPELNGEERRVIVKPIASEGGLRYRDWVASKRAYAAERSGGRVGYVHVPDTGVNGQNELVRQYAGQYHTEALIVDERWNGGGQIPTRFIELLNRPLTNHWATRTSEFSWPMGAHTGPKAMLINESAGSGGDAFPYYFRQAGLGKLIGTRTWGGLVGISGGPAFVDGATVSVPSFAFFELDNTWGVEGYGVAPDIEVVDDPALMQDGGDPQLDRAIEHLLSELESWEAPERQRPPSPIRTGAGVSSEDF